MRFSKSAYIIVVIIAMYACLYIGSSGTFDVKLPGFALTKLFENVWIRVVEGLYDVPPSVAAWEAIIIDGKAYVYYGFFPAIMRGLGMTLLDDSWFGKMGFLSCLIACFFITTFSFLVVYESLRFWTFSKKFLRTLSVCIISIAIVIGGPVLGCILRPNLYEELILWGYAFSTIGIYGFIRFLDDKNSNLALILLSLAASGAFISRVTFGAPLYLLVGITFIFLIYYRRLNKVKLFYLCLSLLGIAFQFWYNYVRFGNVLTFVPTDADDPYYQYIVNHGGVVNPRRIKDLFLYYFVSTKPLRAIRLDFPYFRSICYQLPRTEYFMPYYCRVSPLLVITPYISLFYLGAILSFIKVTLRKDYGRMVKALVFTVPFVLETLLILSFNACEERYKIDLLPLVLVCMFLGFREFRNHKFLKYVLIFCVLSIVFYFEWAFGYGLYQRKCLL